MNPDIRILNPTLVGWHRAWNQIAQQYGDVECYDEETRQVWQYLGTYHNQHEFRHRSLNGKNTLCFVPEEENDFNYLH